MKTIAKPVITKNHYKKKKQQGVDIPLGWRIANARKDAGLTQEKLRIRLGVNQGTVSKWETGVLIPGLRDMVNIARATGKYELLDYCCASCPVCEARNPKPAI